MTELQDYNQLKKNPLNLNLTSSLALPCSPPPAEARAVGLSIWKGAGVYSEMLPPPSLLIHAPGGWEPGRTCEAVAGHCWGQSREGPWAGLPPVFLPPCSFTCKPEPLAHSLGRGHPCLPRDEKPGAFRLRGRGYLCQASDFTKAGESFLCVLPHPLSSGHPCPSTPLFFCLVVGGIEERGLSCDHPGISQLMSGGDVFKLFQSCLTLCNPMDSSPPGSSAHGILQGRTLEWVAMPSSRGSSPPRD